MNWFKVDKAGLAAQLERRGKAFAIFELVQNAWDSDSPRVEIKLNPVPSSPFAVLEVEDFSEEGFLDLTQSYTMFAPSQRASDPNKRGRFNLGEKTVLALCKWARISSKKGSLVFSDKGRRMMKVGKRPKGTLFVGEMRMTREEIEEVADAVKRLIPPVPTFYNGQQIKGPGPMLGSIELSLPTEIADEHGQLRRTWRTGTVELYPIDMGGEILEMGIPIVDTDIKCRMNVLQKVPLSLDRDNVTPSFLAALKVGVANNLHEVLSPDVAAEPWVQSAISDSRISAQAFKSIVAKRFGERAVVGVPNDPRANANAEAAGYTVIHGGSLSGGAWANAKKFGVFQTTSAVFPTPSPDEVAAANAAMGPTCPLCGAERTIE